MSSTGVFKDAKDPMTEKKRQRGSESPTTGGRGGDGYVMLVLSHQDHGNVRIAQKKKRLVGRPEKLGPL